MTTQQVTLRRMTPEEYREATEQREAESVRVLSRLMPAVTSTSHREQAAFVRKLMAVYRHSEDLVRIGAYKPGSDPDLERALQAREAIREFLVQDAQEHVHFAECLKQLERLAAGI